MVKSACRQQFLQCKNSTSAEKTIRTGPSFIVTVTELGLIGEEEMGGFREAQATRPRICYQWQQRILTKKKSEIIFEIFGGHSGNFMIGQYTEIRFQNDDKFDPF